MQFKAATFSLLAAILAAPAALASPSAMPLKVFPDPMFDNADASLSGVACSDGANGLLTKGYTTFGSLPSPFIGGSQFVPNWNSEACGSCWKLTYEDKSIFVIAVDTAGVGFNIAKSAFDALADEAAEQFGGLEATVEAADASDCGF